MAVREPRACERERKEREANQEGKAISTTFLFQSKWNPRQVHVSKRNTSQSLWLENSATIKELTDGNKREKKRKSAAAYATVAAGTVAAYPCRGGGALRACQPSGVRLIRYVRREWGIEATRVGSSLRSPFVIHPLASP